MLFLTKNIYQFLQVIIKQLNIARTDNCCTEYNDSRKQDNRNPNRLLLNITYYGCNHNIYSNPVHVLEKETVYDNKNKNPVHVLEKETVYEK